MNIQFISKQFPQKNVQPTRAKTRSGSGFEQILQDRLLTTASLFREASQVKLAGARYSATAMVRV